MTSDTMDIPLPLEKLSLESIDEDRSLETTK